MSRKYQEVGKIYRPVKEESPWGAILGWGFVIVVVLGAISGN